MMKRYRIKRAPARAVAAAKESVTAALCSALAIALEKNDGNWGMVAPEYRPVVENDERLEALIASINRSELSYNPVTDTYKWNEARVCASWNASGFHVNVFTGNWLGKMPILFASWGSLNKLPFLWTTFEGIASKSRIFFQM